MASADRGRGKDTQKATPLRFTAVFEQEDKYYMGYWPEVPGANGQGRTLAEGRESGKEAIKLILRSRRQEGLRGVPARAIQEIVLIE